MFRTKTEREEGCQLSSDGRKGGARGGGGTGGNGQTFEVVRPLAVEEPTADFGTGFASEIVDEVALLGRGLEGLAKEEGGQGGSELAGGSGLLQGRDERISCRGRRVQSTSRMSATGLVELDEEGVQRTAGLPSWFAVDDGRGQEGERDGPSPFASRQHLAPDISRAGHTARQQHVRTALRSSLRLPCLPLTLCSLLLALHRSLTRRSTRPSPLQPHFLPSLPQAQTSHQVVDSPIM